jgi:hypothetical protein
MPKEWEKEDIPRHLEDENFDVEEYNRLTSTTQNVKGKLISNKLKGTFEYQYNIGFQLDWQLACKTESLIRRGPVIIFEVSTTDSWGRYHLEGYSFLELPRKEGHYQLASHFWKPYESLSSQVFSYFLGGAVKVKDIVEIAASSLKMGEGIDSVMNRFTLKTLTSGKIKLSMNISTQNQYNRLKKNQNGGKSRSEETVSRETRCAQCKGGNGAKFGHAGFDGRSRKT